MTAQGCKWGSRYHFSHGAAPSPPAAAAHDPASALCHAGGDAAAMSLCRPSPASAADVWEPPRELQRIDVPVPESTGYTLFFPIELTNKDYLRRVLDIVAQGVQGTVKRMIGRHGARLGPIGSQKQKGGKAQYDFNTTCDLYYLAST